MQKAVLEQVEDSVIDETFKNLANPAEVHRLGREDIVEGRPGDILVEAVRTHAAAGGFDRKGEMPAEDGVRTSTSAKGRIALDEARVMAAGVEAEIKTSEISE